MCPIVGGGKIGRGVWGGSIHSLWQVMVKVMGGADQTYNFKSVSWYSNQLKNTWNTWNCRISVEKFKLWMQGGLICQLQFYLQFYFWRLKMLNLPTLWLKILFFSLPWAAPVSGMWRAPDLLLHLYTHPASRTQACTSPPHLCRPMRPHY